MGSIATTARIDAARDDGLIARAAAGDAAAFDLLVATRLDRCYRLAFAILGNESDAADATQEGMVAAWRQLRRLRDPSAFDGWLNRIVANAARMSRRHRTRLREIRMPVTDEGDGSAADTRSAGSLSPSHDAAVVSADAFARAFERLRDKERVILVLHHLEQRPLVEIAGTLGIPIGTVKWRLHAAREALERALEAEA